MSALVSVVTEFLRKREARAEVTRTAPPPLVVDLGRGFFAWIQNGVGYTLSPGARAWSPLADNHAGGLGGHVLSSAEVAELVLSVGRPT